MLKPLIPGDLIDSLIQGRVHLFVGSGASAAADLTGWDALIEEMKIIIRKENRDFSSADLEAFLQKEDPLDIADVFRNTVKDHRYFSFLREHYRRPVSLSRLHRAIADLPVKTVFTTNYDKLLETAFRKTKGEDPAVIVYPQQLGFIGDTEIRIIKLHGDIDHPATIILTRTDYATYSSRHRDFERELHQSINNSTMLFIGFGIRDPNFRRIYQDARSLYDSGKRLAYAVMVGTNSVEQRLWESDGLKIISVNRHSEVTAYLRLVRGKVPQ